MPPLPIQSYVLYDLSYIKQGKCINYIFNDEFKIKKDLHNGDTGYWFWLSWEDSLTLDKRNSSIRWNNLDLLNNSDENQEKGLFINSHWERGFYFYFGKSGMLRFTLRFV